jgi:DNA-binding protein HU-beta
MVHTLQQALIGAQSSRPRLVGIRTSMTMTINKTDLIQRLADKHTLSKAEAGRVLETLLDTIVTAVKKRHALA